MFQKNIFLILLCSLLFISCSSKQPKKVLSATILFKTPTMKFYDLGFIKKYNNFISLNILNAGTTILKLNVYKDKICKSTFQCISSQDFNYKYLSSTYNDNFLYNLLNQNKIYFKDTINNIFIKIKYH